MISASAAGIVFDITVGVLQTLGAVASGLILSGFSLLSAITLIMLLAREF
jgi:hypothetical protein